MTFELRVGETVYEIDPYNKENSKNEVRTLPE